MACLSEGFEHARARQGMNSDQVRPAEPQVIVVVVELLLTGAPNVSKFTERSSMISIITIIS